VFEQQVSSRSENTFDPKRERLPVLIGQGDLEVVILVVRMPRDMQ
jgi:hypothetical protein